MTDDTEPTEVPPQADEGAPAAPTGSPDPTTGVIPTPGPPPPAAAPMAPVGWPPTTPPPPVWPLPPQGEAEAPGQSGPGGPGGVGGTAAAAPFAGEPMNPLDPTDPGLTADPITAETWAPPRLPPPPPGPGPGTSPSGNRRTWLAIAAVAALIGGAVGAGVTARSAQTVPTVRIASAVWGAPFGLGDVIGHRRNPSICPTRVVTSSAGTSQVAPRHTKAKPSGRSAKPHST